MKKKSKLFEVRMMDEMEMAINFRAIRLAYSFMVIALMVYCLFTMAATGDLPAIPFTIVMLGNVIHSTATAVMRKQMADGEEDEE